MAGPQGLPPPALNPFLQTEVHDILQWILIKYVQLESTYSTNARMQSMLDCTVNGHG